MLRLLAKIFSTPKSIVAIKPVQSDRAQLDVLGKKLHGKVGKLFKGSLAIRQVAAGSDNAVEHELVALSNAFYDCERFGIYFVASPRHADMLMVSGPVARNMAEALRRAYDATPTPKIVVAVGDDAIDGGLFRGSYATYDGVGSVIPVDYTIPGNPPSPETILSHLLAILEDLDTQSST